MWSEFDQKNNIFKPGEGLLHATKNSSFVTLRIDLNDQPAGIYFPQNRVESARLDPNLSNRLGDGVRISTTIICRERNVEHLLANGIANGVS